MPLIRPVAGVISSLGSIGDVDLTGAVTGSVLYRNASGVFVPSSAPSADDLLQWNGTAWTPIALSLIDLADLGAKDIGDLDDVDTTGVATNDILRYNGTTFVDTAGNFSVDASGNLTLAGNISGDGSGMTIAGGNAATETLTLVANTGVTPENDPVVVNSYLSLFPAATTFDQGAVPNSSISMGGGATWTLNTTVSAVFALTFNPVLSFQTNGNAFVPTFLFNAQPTIQAAASVTNFGTFMTLNSQPIFDPVDNTVTALNMVTLQHQPDFRRTGSGGLTVTQDRAINVAGILNAGATVSRRVGVETGAYTTKLGTLTAQAAFIANFNSSQATDTTQLLIGTATIPSGNYGIYQGGTLENRLNGLTRFSTSSYIVFDERTTTPSGTPADGAEARIYMKADKLVIQYNDAGIVRYKYLDLTGTGVTWTHTPTAP